MADAGPPQAADTPSASPEVGPDPLDADTLRNLQRLLDDGEIDADEFERRKAEALGLAEKNATAGALSRLPEDMLQNVLSFLVLKQDGIAQRFLLNVRVMQRRVSGLLESTDDDEDSGCTSHTRCLQSSDHLTTVSASSVRIADTAAMTSYFGFG